MIEPSIFRGVALFQQLKDFVDDRAVGRVIDPPRVVAAVGAGRDVSGEPSVFLKQDPKIVSGPATESVQLTCFEALQLIDLTSRALAFAKDLPFLVARPSAPPVT